MGLNFFNEGFNTWYSNSVLVMLSKKTKAGPLLRKLVHENELT